MLHDLGKYQPEWQQYLTRVSGYDAENAHIEGTGGHPNHSTAGALWACDKYGVAGRVLAYLIAGHHAGLSDWNTENHSLEARLSDDRSRAELANALKGSAPAEVFPDGAWKPDLKKVPGGKNGFSLWVRMLFSCLVDADFLDTEAYMDAEKGIKRGNWPKLEEIHTAFDGYMADKTRGVEDTDVNQARADVLSQCRSKATEAPGLFSLTVPTGGGKTLSSLAFALEHAKKYQKRRIIYVIPYTSIIEQTADVFRSAFAAVGEEVLIEHHSNAEADPKQENSRSRLAAENWDAPVIVTTSVQFFESLFAAKTSRCRKLHNICNSIVVLDEAQLLPPEFLQPILDGLNLLSKHYGVTVVLSTATQPALATVNDYLDPKKHINGLDNVREIIANPDALYQDLKRVAVELPADMNKQETWDDVAARIGTHESALAIVNTRKDARDLHRLLPKGTLHLSALMCGAHRSAVIAEIKQRMKAGTPTRVVSTQLVEAGVDIDFPVVYRAMAGLDSIAQAAGRCNREGKLERGKVVVFVPPKAPPKGLLLKGANACKSVLHGHAADPLERSLFEAYFRKLYYECDLDKKQIRHDLRMDGKNLEALAVNFRTAAENFKLIEDGDQVAVVVRFSVPEEKDGGVEKWITTLRKGKPERWLMRKLQRYIVRIHHRYAEPMRRHGDIEELMPGLFVQVADGLYNPEFGLQLEHVQLTPDQTIV
jgi:CRISPR-associated endonuclease/helicase Cas3